MRTILLAAVAALLTSSAMAQIPDRYRDGSVDCIRLHGTAACVTDPWQRFKEDQREFYLRYQEQQAERLRQEGRNCSVDYDHGPAMVRCR
jgi:hypothetical protein